MLSRSSETQTTEEEEYLRQRIPLGQFGGYQHAIYIVKDALVPREQIQFLKLLTRHQFAQQPTVKAFGGHTPKYYSTTFSEVIVF